MFRVVGYFEIGCPDLSLLAMRSGIVLACTLSNGKEIQNQGRAPCTVSGSGIPSKRNDVTLPVTRRNSRTSAIKKLF